MSQPPRRVIGRILSIGFALPGVRVDNFSMIGAPAIFDYDAMVIDPAAHSRLIESVIDGTSDAKTFAGQPVRNEPAAGEVALADVLRRRQDEVAALLAHDGVVVCFGHAPAVHRGVAAIDALRDDWWLGAHAPAMVAGEGAQVHVVDYAHPMAPFVHQQAANLQYRAYMDIDRTPRFRESGVVFARSYGGAAVGFEVPVERGRIVVLPALRALPSGDARYAMSEALQSGIRRMLGVMAEGRPPWWLDSFDLPGLAERDAARKAAQDAAAEAQRALDAATAAHEELAKYQRLLWQEGALGLDNVVLDALRLIGCEIYDRKPDAVEAIIDGVRVLVEIDASEGAVELAPHFRLRQRIESAIERLGEAPRGLLIVNGYRLKAPAERPSQASPALVTAAETMRYGIVTTAGLFEAVRAQFSRDEAAVETYRRRLAEAVGLLQA